jgi:hypothetical protein
MTEAEQALQRTEALFAADPDHQRSIQEEQIRNEHDFIAWKHELSEALRQWRGPDDVLSSEECSELGSAYGEPASLLNGCVPLGQDDDGFVA